MLRIAHISDLHFVDSSIDTEAVSSIGVLAGLAYTVGKVVGPEVVADGHSEDKLEALKNVFRSLRPDVIVVTGDITNYGDAESFRLAVASIKELKAIAGAKHVFCVPGNHDSLVERATALRKKGAFARALIAAVSVFNPTASRIRRISLDQKLKDLLIEGKALPLLKTYEKYCASEFGNIDPSNPVFVKAGWGEVAFFLFNSTNDPAFMANEGSIGAFQYNALNRYLDDPANCEKIDSSVRIALLHHHPLNNPSVDTGRIERFYDEMTDGTRFLEYLGKRKFHFIFHGHQHREYLWENQPEFRPHISAAGSALAGDKKDGSFNVIDLMTPFEAVYHRFDYTATGFGEANHAERTVKVHSLDDIRVSKPSEPRTGEDTAIQNLFAGRREAFDDLHQYDLLEYAVSISPDQMYAAKYRRKGKVVGPTKSYSLAFVVTGNPPRSLESLEVSACDGSANGLSFDCPYNAGTQKVIRVLHARPINPGSEFDVTLEFKWQASEEYPNTHDAINLLYFLRPIGRLSYRVDLPWKPAQFDVAAYGLRKSSPDYDYKVTPKSDHMQEHSFTMNSPSPLVYLISLGPTPSV